MKKCIKKNKINRKGKKIKRIGGHSYGEVTLSDLWENGQRDCD